MSAILPASSPRHKIHAAESAYTTSGGLPVNFKFTYGTWNCGDAVTGHISQLGIITDYQVAPLGTQENLLDGGGSTIAIALKDPGWMVTATVVVRQVAAPNGMGPDRMTLINFYEKVEGAESGSWPTLKAVVTGCTVKYTREGWTTLEITAECRDSMMLGDTWGTTINEIGGVEAVVSSPE